MTFLLVRVSGVSMLDKHLISSRPGYEQYMARTSAFVPRPPRT
jgi:steroid 5-alpha reductase family enzyme